MIYEEYPVLGFNYRMTDIQAAIGREQLKRLPDIVARTARAGGALSRRGSNDVPDSSPREPSWARTNWQSYAIRVERDASGRSCRLLDAGIATRRRHERTSQGAYGAGGWRAAGPLGESEAAQETGIVLPLFHQLAESDQDRVINEIRCVVSAVVPDLESHRGRPSGQLP